MLIDANRSCLLLVDIQQKLLPAIIDADSLLAHCTWLTQAAQRLNLPVLASEQYPAGLGPTVEALNSLLEPTQIHDKRHFSCAADPDLLAVVEHSGCTQIVIAGIEAHVCVLQSAIGFKQAGFEVFVVEDCVGSRTEADKAAALARLRQCGVQVISREMALFEWLHTSSHPQFREISRDFLR